MKQDQKENKAKATTLAVAELDRIRRAYEPHIAGIHTLFKDSSSADERSFAAAAVKALLSRMVSSTPPHSDEGSWRS